MHVIFFKFRKHFKITNCMNEVIVLDFRMIPQSGSQNFLEEFCHVSPAASVTVPVSAISSHVLRKEGRKIQSFLLVYNFVIQERSL